MTAPASAPPASASTARAVVPKGGSAAPISDGRPLRHTQSSSTVAGKPTNSRTTASAATAPPTGAIQRIIAARDGMVWVIGWPGNAGMLCPSARPT